jgi:hypothetical protein
MPAFDPLLNSIPEQQSIGLPAKRRRTAEYAAVRLAILFNHRRHAETAQTFLRAITEVGMARSDLITPR